MAAASARVACTCAAASCCRQCSAASPHWSGVARPYICGIDTESCVLKTAVDAFERDLTPWIVEDACASHAGPEPHYAGLLVARRFIGRSQIISAAGLPETVSRCRPDGAALSTQSAERRP